MLAPHEERLAEQLAVQEEPSAPSARVGDGEREVLRNLFTLLSVPTRGWTADDWTHLASPESLSIWSGDDEVMKVVARPSESREVPYCEAWEYDVVEYVQRQRCERCHGVAGGREEARQVTSPTSTSSPLSLLPHPSTPLHTPSYTSHPTLHASTMSSDTAAIADLHRAFAVQQKAFLADQYPSLETRVGNLHKLTGMMMANRQAIKDALDKDFGSHP